MFYEGGLDCSQTSCNTLYSNSDLMFIVPYYEDTSLAGAYQLTYKVWYQYYPHVMVESQDAFVLTIEDPCDPPSAIYLDSRHDPLVD